MWMSLVWRPVLIGVTLQSLDKGELNEILIGNIIHNSKQCRT